MSGIVSIRGYFRTHMNALGYREWTDGFNFENIPATILHDSYHIETRAGARVGSYDQGSQDMLQDCTVRLFLNGFRNAASAIDDAMVNYDAILTRVLAPGYRLAGNLHNVYLQTMAIKPIDDSNDNSVILELNFTCLIMIAT